MSAQQRRKMFHPKRQGRNSRIRDYKRAAKPAALLIVGLGGSEIFSDINVADPPLKLVKKFIRKLRLGHKIGYKAVS